MVLSIPVLKKQSHWFYSEKCLKIVSLSEKYAVYLDI